MTKSGQGLFRVLVLIGALAGAASLAVLAQLPEPGSAQSTAPNPLTDPTVKPGKMLLFDLEA